MIFDPTLTQFLFTECVELFELTNELMNELNMISEVFDCVLDWQKWNPMWLSAVVDHPPQV